MRKLLTICVVAGFVLLATTAQASLITSVVRTNGATSGQPQIIPGPSPAGLQENSPPYMDRLDRNYAWQQVPAPLLGADYVMTYCDDKTALNVSYAVTLSHNATLYVLIDDRYIAGTGWRSSPYESLFDPPFPWLTDNSAGAVFTDTGLRLSHTGYHSGSNEYYEGKFWVYAADVSAGIYTLGPTRGYEPYTSSRTFYGIAAVAKIEVEIDIKPGSDPNPINPGSKGLVPVAIFSSPEFEATQVDPTSVFLAGAGVAVRGKGKLMAHEEDVNGDGLVDLVVQVETQGFDDLGAGGTVELTGITFGGENIVGYDEVIIVPPDK